MTLPDPEQAAADRALMQQRDDLRAHRRAASGRSALPVLSLNMTPMIDCVFLLMTYFLVALDFRPPEDALSLDAAPPLASSTTSRTRAEQPFELPQRPVLVRVRSTADGQDDFSIETDEPVLGTPPSARELERRARAARGVALPESQSFTVIPTRDTRWEHALVAFRALRRAGFTQITLNQPAER